MKWYYITFRSVTLAQRAEAVLRRSGISCHLQRTPRWMEQRGCGYSLQVRRETAARCVQLFQENGIVYSKVYEKYDEAAAQEVVL